MLTGKYILNHQPFSPRLAASNLTLARSLNNCYTPFSLWLINKMQEAPWDTLPCSQNKERGLSMEKSYWAIVGKWTSILGVLPKLLSRLLTVTCLPSQSIKMCYYKRHFGIWLRNGSLIAMGVRAEDPPVILNGVASVTLPVLKYINSFYYPTQQERRHPTDCQISDTRLIEWSQNP